MLVQPVLAQTPIYTFATGNTTPSPLPTVNSSHTIDLDFDAIKAFPELISLSFPDGTSTNIRKARFDHRSGYLFFDDFIDPPGTPEIRVNPEAEQTDFSFMWYGSNQDYDLVITAYKGLLTATISGNTKRYVIKKSGRKYQLIHVNLAGFPSSIGDAILPDPNRPNNNKNENSNKKADQSYTSNLISFDYNKNKQQRIGQNRDAINPNVIDLLIVYNDAARIDAGGSATDPNDTQNIELKIIAEVDNLNMAMLNSRHNTSSAELTIVTRFHVAKLNDFVHGTNFSNALNAFRILNSVNILRDQVGADIVSGILEQDSINFNACGVAFAHTGKRSIDPWTIGAGFSEYAYNIVAENCMMFDNTFTHEFGHVLGANHQRLEENQSFINRVINNGYPYAFAYKRPMGSGTFYSVVSSEGSTSRRLNFSNPNIRINNTPTGLVIRAHNQRVIEELTVFATNYRQRPDLIFANGMEQ